MSKRRKDTGSFWIGYSDLMTSLFFVFLVLATTLALGFRYQASIYEADARELQRIRSIAQAADSLTAGGRFKFNEAQSRYELKNDFQFEGGGDVEIPPEAHAELVAAGRDIERVLKSVSDTTDVRFKVVIEGRTARHLDHPDKRRLNADRYDRNKNISYERALALDQLWKDNGIHLAQYNTELFIAGAGFGGKGRYPMERGKEHLNKQMIVQVIPFLSPR